MHLREYKSSVFSMLMEIPEYALDTYNALNNSNYDDPALLTILKLEGKIILSVRNDASFLFDSYLNLYEHQSTYNPNMSLRFLLYYADLIKKLVEKNEYNLYGSRKITIPTPKFVVFYNGIDKQPAVKEFRLSDAFERECDNYDLELVCTMYNINPGFNDEMLNRSRVLFGYTTFVGKVRMYQKQFRELSDAVKKAMDECMKEDILAEFFKKNRQEVLDVAALDFTFERQLELTARDSREEGYADGRAEGIEIGRTDGIETTYVTQIKAKRAKGKEIAKIADEIEQSPAYVQKLMEKYHIS
ncbi:MAG: hypothetical protein ACI4F4_07455 [Lachnospiraceae bacterium]